MIEVREKINEILLALNNKVYGEITMIPYSEFSHNMVIKICTHNFKFIRFISFEYFVRTPVNIIVAETVNDYSNDLLKNFLKNS